MIELICFDLDGVVVNTNTLHIDAWKATFRQYEAESYSIENRLDYTEGWSSDKIIDFFFTSTDDLKKEEIKNTKNLLFRRLIHEKGCELYPDTIQLLKLLKNDGYPLALVSSSSSADYIINYIELTDIFDLIVSSNESLKCKPAPDPYLRAISFFESDLTIAFEDTGIGVISAQTAGCFCIGIIRKKKQRNFGADHYLSTGFEIDSDYLENIVKKWLMTRP